MTNEEAKEWIISHYGLENDGTKQSEVMNYVVKALEQEPCEDAVSREVALEAFSDYVSSGYADSVEDFEEYSKIIANLPSVQPKQKTGHWVVISSTDMYCSQCNELENLDTSKNYCPNCGAKMVEPQESEDKE